MKNNFKPQNKRVLLELDNLYNDKLDIGGVEFRVDTAFRRAFNVVQKATVIAADEDCDLIEGDTVYVHHFVAEEEKRFPVKDKEYRWLDYFQIYCRVRDGIMKTLGSFVLVEPIKYDESNFKKTITGGFMITGKSGTQYVDRVGRIFSKGEDVPNKVDIGDLVFFNKNCEYEINIEGKNLYRMEYRDIITVIDEDIEFTV
jgi:co-chaperonin GroES (HSP10)